MLLFHVPALAQDIQLDELGKPILTDTVVKDSGQNFPISKDKPESEVTYHSKDSIVYDAKTKKLYLHNGAEIGYQEVKVNADYIVFDQDSNTLTALELQNIEGDSSGKSRIAQGTESSTFSALKYNFKSKRALVENAYSQYGEGFILSEQVKRNNDESINGYKNLYTTCNEEHPHFGIAARRIKIIPNKVAVTGSANLVIEDIPTPLYLPFGMFPLKQGQRSGFKLPTYDMSENLGFGLREGGYYFAINDHIDLLALADIYALGTWRAGFISNYIYRYRFNGGFGFNYAYNKIGDEFEPGNQSNRNFNLTWNHTINPNVMPGSNFSANVNIASSRYNTFNSYDANTYLNNSLSSNISYSKSWAGKPYNFSVALRHNQNNATRLVQVTLPEMNFSVNQIFPFQFRKDIIKPRWYEKIGASYQISAINRIDFYDSNFSISNLNANDFQNGIKHTIPISASYNILKFVNMSMTAGYNEYWYTKKFLKQYNFSEAKLDTNRMTGFFTARDFNVGTSFSTRIYGIKLFKKGWLKGIRHVLTPQVNLNYRPDFGGGIGQTYYQTFTDKNYTSARLSYFDGSVYGGPPDGRVGGIGLNLGNTLQLKVKSKKDTINGVQKINIIDGLNFSTFYNLAVDSFNWSNLAISYRTTLFQNINLSGAVSYSPYAIDKETGRRTPTTLYKQNGRILRFESANLAIGASLPVKKNSALNQASEGQLQAIGPNYGSYADFNIPWSLNLNYNVSFRKLFLVATQKDTLTLTQDMNFSGDVNLTTKWKIGFSSGYDFTAKQLSFTSFDIYRDLHCWEMRLNLIPFGFRKSYNFALNVKASVLQDLKLLRRKDFRDNL
ncbi:MAG: LPS-assembly protein LptD [Chitinophagaceae bacterium]|nr:LPS-assembly protein LptD [Chitinophagaceae bacterium]